MSIPLNRHIKAQFRNVPRALAVRDFTVPLFLTHEFNVAMTKGRYITVSSSDEVGRLFGLDSEVYSASKLAFGHPNAPSKIMIGLWNKEGINIPASTNAIVATQAPAMVVDFSNLFNFTITSNDYEETVNVDLSATVPADHDAVVTALNAALGEDTHFAFSLSDGKFVLSSKVEGLDPSSENIKITTNFGRDIANLTRLADSFGTIKVQGQAQITGVAESISKALVKITELTQEFYGVYCTEAMTDAELLEFHEWIVSSEFERIGAYTIIKDSEIEYTEANPVYKIAKMNSGRMMAQLNKTGQKHAVVQLLIEATSVIWTGSNTAKTNKFKQQNLVQSDPNITTNIADKCDALGVNYYTDVRSYNMVAEGTMLGGEWIDVTVFKDAFLEYCQVEAFNTIRNDVPQTDEGQQRLIGSLIKVGEQFRANGSIAGGTWTLGPIGNLKTGDYLDLGYYFYSDSFSKQTTADREARKAMPINVALKYAGFMHTVDLFFTLNQ
ncbi:MULTISPECIES: DUF3383 family protein [Enterobacteriaceae]|uniref:DUF3383 family protein n=1 Tax=Enterobacteriaceae TaxID=543 RepID=UPI002E2A10FE|nr:DUF3383 family protein [Klebsiella pneumoniae]MED6004939.1 DUF3383 family protein [Klebsiella pneumoniae]MED6058247.1 DUF3383 family protein [Klebsiella pneumoniae]